MRILLDTNILIYREENEILSNNLQRLLRALTNLNAKLFIHPESIRELRNDTNEIRRQIKLSKVGAYPVLEQPPNPLNDDAFLAAVGLDSHKKRGETDNALLYAIYKDAAHFLVTEDKGIHKKAFKLSVRDRVLSIEEGVELFTQKAPNDKISSIIALKYVPAFLLNIDDPLFDSLKEDYPEFPQWWRKISRDGRKCWVYCNNDGTIGALLAYKPEDEAVELASTQALPKRRRLKITTLTVSPQQQGYKIGELFIKLSAEFAQKNNLSEIYLTHYIKKPDFLVSLIEEYGFRKIGAKLENHEPVFHKRFFPERGELNDLSVTEISKRYWPSFCDSSNVSAFIVPIRPKYHNRLFMEAGDRQTLLLEHSGELISEGNAIKKAYLSHAKIKKMSPGDILLFYRSQDKHEVTTLGVVEQVEFDLKTVDEIVKLVRKRSVYSVEEIQSTVLKPTTVILFSWHLHLPEPLRLEELIQHGILKTAPQTIMQISHEKYLNIKAASGIDERFTVN